MDGPEARPTHATNELVRRGEPHFSDAYAAGIGLYVIQTLGPNLVQAGFIEESARLRAEEDYSSYIQHTLRSQRHSMLTVEGRRPS